MSAYNRRGLPTVSTCLLLAQFCVFCKTQPVELKWGELSPLVTDHRVELKLRDGATIGGEAITVRDSSIVVNTKKSSNRKIRPLGSIEVPRDSILSIKLERYPERWGRSIGKTVGVIAGLGLAAYATANTASSGVAVGAVVGITSGTTILGHFIGKNFDRKVLHIIVVP